MFEVVEHEQLLTRADGVGQRLGRPLGVVG
jgi:hypothetical protein